MGPTQARRALGEGAWTSREPATGSRPRHRRLAKRPPALQASRWPAPGRRCTRDRQLSATGTKAQQVGVAMARALVGGMGARATQVPLPPKASSA